MFRAMRVVGDVMAASSSTQRHTLINYATGGQKVTGNLRSSVAANFAITASVTGSVVSQNLEDRRHGHPVCGRLERRNRILETVM
jgi:hypothetical protein